MLYHLLSPLAKLHIVFNLFNYITFRVAGATVTALIMAFVLGPPIIRRLRDRKVGQVIRAEGPASHQGKRGTPTMGGIIILLATIVPTLLWARLDSRYVVVALVATLWTGAIGFVDDYLKIVRAKSQGLVARWKLVGQLTFGLALGIYLLAMPLLQHIDAPSTQLPLFKYVLLIMPAWLYVLFVTVVVAGTSNAVNITDGLDGLATGLTAIAAVLDSSACSHSAASISSHHAARCRASDVPFCCRKRSRASRELKPFSVRVAVIWASNFLSSSTVCSASAAAALTG